ncbi:hypothetical protein VPLG_00091 [Vibrio phage eugene 12A10]|uniref:hypothetical protein n=1 Tax=Vibrio phage eugene 12A10 TaxID=573172 RepID=UPI000351747C|nr:hypothetical protein VPLG_00091 [Vibrio phage eugene 12A10]AGN51530.1 hypothetical protein VPLG_00091 [Vibrio phage eugene 12A10]
MTIQVLEVWARVEHVDVSGIAQVRNLEPSETERGWVNLATASAQQINGILKVITQHTGCNPFEPQAMIATVTTPKTAVDWVDGGNIPEDAVELVAHYGAKFPVYQAPPTGWKYIVRKQ